MRTIAGDLACVSFYMHGAVIVKVRHIGLLSVCNWQVVKAVLSEPRFDFGELSRKRQSSGEYPNVFSILYPLAHLVEHRLDRFSDFLLAFLVGCQGSVQIYCQSRFVR